MAISAGDVKKLRDMTGAGMMDCKEALTETGGDFDLAVDFLRTKGLAKAAKKADRATKEGLVQALVDASGKVGALIQVNCETDFVARNAEFIDMVDGLVKQAHAKAPADLAAFLAQDCALEPGKTVETFLMEKIAKIGENMSISRVAHYAPARGGVHAYIHPGSRVGVLIEAECDPADFAGFHGLVHDLAMQVAAAMPRFVRREEVDAATLEHEKNIAREQLREQGKPDAVIEKILEGKMGKFYEEVCLVEQLFIKDQETKVQAVIDAAAKAAGKPITITRFVRFQLGEGV